MRIELEGGETRELTMDRLFYCPVHGKCSGVLARPPLDRSVETIGISPLFFCEQCGKVKIRDVWGNCSTLCGARVIT
jgi:hypothetical protein